MFRVKISLQTYTDHFYAKDEEQILAIVLNNKAKIIEVEWAYKRLDLYWQLDKCWLTIDGNYKTLKQLSRDYLDRP